MHISDRLLENRRLETLVENQTSHTLQHAEMHIFETHQQAEKVLLEFNNPVLASMLQGKKVMHLQDRQSFDFLPGESLILPASELMCIDFPEAQMENPTRCLAMTIDEEKIREAVCFLNERMPKAEKGEWRFTDYNFHFTNDLAIHQILHRLLFLFAEQHPSKDVFADFLIQELVMRILQAETQKIYSEQSLTLSTNNRMAFAIQYIRDHLSEPLTIAELSEKACMSESHFYRTFKIELGISPVDFINNERIKLATSMLHDPERRVKDIYLDCGFNSVSYFTRLFKRKKQLSPREYQQRLSQSA